MVHFTIKSMLALKTSTRHDIESIVPGGIGGCRYDSDDKVGMVTTFGCQCWGNCNDLDKQQASLCTSNDTGLN